jgi:hypothetical protein
VMPAIWRRSLRRKANPCPPRHTYHHVLLYFDPRRELLKTAMANRMTTYHTPHGQVCLPSFWTPLAGLW